MNIFPCPATGVWECERTSACASNFTLPNFGLLLRDSQLPGAQPDGIGLADPSASSSSSAATATVTVTAGGAASSSTPTATATASTGSDALAVGLGVGIPLGALLVACVALLVRQQRRLKAERAVAAPLGGFPEGKGGGYKGREPGTYGAQELPGQGAVPELSENKNRVHELGGNYMPGSPPPPPPLSK